MFTENIIFYCTCCYGVGLYYDQSYLFEYGVYVPVDKK